MRYFFQIPLPRGSTHFLRRTILAGKCWILNFSVPAIFDAARHSQHCRNTQGHPADNNAPVMRSDFLYQSLMLTDARVQIHLPAQHSYYALAFIAPDLSAPASSNCEAALRAASLPLHQKASAPARRAVPQSESKVISVNVWPFSTCLPGSRSGC